MTSAPYKSSIEIPKTNVLLIDDQRIFAEVIKRIFEAEEDISFHFCDDPAKALEVALEVKPTVILQDLVMPGTDGIDMIKLFRSHKETIDIPMIVLSSRIESNIKSQAFSLGANDYMVKLPDRKEFVARIRYHSKAYANLIAKNAAFEALKSDLQEATRYIQSLLPERIETPEFKTDWKFISSMDLGGDTFGYHAIDDDHYAFYLLDVCGHGVGAALLSASAINVIRHQNLTGVDFKKPKAVLEGLNTAFDMNKHNQMYFTLWYGVYKKTSRILEYASAGHPPAILITPESSHHLQTENTFIGNPFDVPFKDNQVSIPLKSQLYIFSDGIYEMEPAEGKTPLNIPKLTQLFTQTSQSPLADTFQAIKDTTGREDFDDDFSLLEIQFA